MGDIRLVVQLIGPRHLRKRFLQWLAKHKEIDLSGTTISNSLLDHITLVVLDEPPLDTVKLPVQSAVNYLKSLGEPNE